MANISVTVQDGNNITLVTTPTPTQVITIDRGIAGPAGPAGVPGGSTTQVQYNLASNFAGSPNFTFNGTLLNLIGSLSVSGTTNFGATINTGTGVTTGNATIELGANRTGDGNALLDFHATSGSDYEFRIIRASGLNGITTMTSVGTGNIVIQQQGAGNLIFSTNSAERMRLDSAGNFGIGTGAPSSEFHIARSDATTYNGAATDGQLAAGSTVFVQQTAGTNTGVSQIVFQSRITFPYNRIVSSGGSAPFMTFVTNNAERMRISSAGDVGIGTTAPGAKLELYGNYANAKWNDGTRTGFIALNSDGSDPQFRFESSSTFVFANTSGTKFATINSSGNLGLGVVPSKGKLHIKQATEFSGISLESNYSTNEWAFVHDGSSSLRFSYNGGGANAGEKMRLDASGNLGLGVTPSAWAAGNKALQMPAGSFYSGGTSQLLMGQNVYGNATNDIYVATGFASRYYQTNGTHIWQTAPSGTAGNAITFTQAMTLDASGRFLVGQTSAGAQNANSMYFDPTTGYGANLVISHLLATPSGREYQQYLYNGTAIGTITQNGTTGVLYNIMSDYRLKNITGPIISSGAYIDSLKPVEGTWKADGSTFVGLIAHETQEVSRTTVATGTKDGEEMQGMDYSSSEIIANLIAEIQSLRKRVTQLESK